MGNLDARVRYTRMMIENSFMKLLEEKAATKITVTEVCQLAQINRATFYKHYLDVPDLLEQIEQRLLNELKETVGEVPSAKDLSRKYLLDAFVRVLEYIKNGALQYMLLAGTGADPTLPSKTFDMINNLFYPIIQERMSDAGQEKQEMLYHYLTLGCGGVLMTWIRNGMKEDCREMAEFLLKLSMGAASALD